MHMIAKLTAVTVTAAALLGTVGVTAAAATPSTTAAAVSPTTAAVEGDASASQAVYHRTFVIINNSSYTMALAGYDGTHDDDELPLPDAVVAPGKAIAFNVTYRFFEQRELQVYFTVSNPQGHNIGLYRPVLRVDGGAGLTGFEVREIPDQLGLIKPDHVYGEPQFSEVFDRVPAAADAQHL
ncbi:hypothetical protein [Pseudonocardia sp. N23]|uniref:hypothetical protein n=1 Tax=Pseudonocardia sp. N23 TaxID=1987376 RepID=UPI000C034115|nr:hypothetical protein [Pseudonocardia sp. N23]GAY08359.1 hypothetical protein TOK_1916 [Pseudonocardia sp. N23]